MPHREITTFDIGPSGPSYTPERKRVRLALLRAYPPFLNELHALGETVENYRSGFDSRKQADLQDRWQVTVEVAPASKVDTAEIFDVDHETDYLENLSRLSKEQLPDITTDQPVLQLWDARYVEESMCRGEADLSFSGEKYVAIPMTVSINEAIAFLKAAGVGEQRGYLTNTDEEGLAEAIQVLILSRRDGLKVPDIVRRLHPGLTPETFKSKSTRYANLLKQMIAIIEPPPTASQQN